jgi:hypothetical protein
MAEGKHIDSLWEHLLQGNKLERKIRVACNQLVRGRR